VPIRDLIGVDANTPKDQIPFIYKFIAGGGSGAIASVIANPTDLVKVSCPRFDFGKIKLTHVLQVRLQVEGLQAQDPKFKAKYGTMFGCISKTYQEEGVRRSLNAMHWGELSLSYATTCRSLAFGKDRLQTSLERLFLLRSSCRAMTK
jgi:hypothetical protein